MSSREPAHEPEGTPLRADRGCRPRCTGCRESVRHGRHIERRGAIYDRDVLAGVEAPLELFRGDGRGPQLARYRRRRTYLVNVAAEPARRPRRLAVAQAPTRTAMTVTASLNTRPTPIQFRPQQHSAISYRANRFVPTNKMPATAQDRCHAREELREIIARARKRFRTPSGRPHTKSATTDAEPSRTRATLGARDHLPEELKRASTRQTSHHP